MPQTKDKEWDTQPTKTRYVYIKTKESDDLIGCGWCFALLDERDDYCWNCGCEIDDEEGVSYLDELWASVHKYEAK